MRGSDGRVQVRRTRQTGWTTARRQAFLDRLAATCSVRESLEAVGLSSFSLYELKKRDAAFAEACDAALTAHFEEVEFELARLSKEALAGHGAQSDEALAEARVRTAANPTLALELLKMRRAGDARERSGGVRRRNGGRPAVADKAQLAKDIMRLVKAIKARRKEAE